MHIVLEIVKNAHKSMTVCVYSRYFSVFVQPKAR